MTYQVRMMLVYCRSFGPLGQILSSQWENLLDYDYFHAAQVVLISVLPLEPATKQFLGKSTDFPWILTGNFSTLEYILWQIPSLNYDSTHLFMDEMESINLLLIKLAHGSRVNFWDATCQPRTSHRNLKVKLEEEGFETGWADSGLIYE